MHKSESKAQPSRIILLDLFRVLAALAVVFYHFCFRGNLGDRPCDASYSMGWLFAFGYQGVNFFFMISGFVIAFSAAQGEAFKFLHSRFLRLIPAFVICCTITFLFCRLFDDGRMTVGWMDYLLNLSMISGLFGIPAVDGVYWSLVAEIQFYVMVAVVLRLCRVKYLEWFMRIWMLLAIALYFFPVPGANRLLIVDYASLFCAGATYYFCYSDRVTSSRLVVLAVSFASTLICSLGKAAQLAQHYNHSVSTSGFFYARF